MKIYVGNLSRTINEDKLNDLFQQFGEITSVKIIKDRFTNEPRGFGFVDMSSNEQGQAAIAALNGVDVDGQSIRVNEARPLEARSNNNGPRRFGTSRPRNNNNNNSGGGWRR